MMNTSRPLSVQAENSVFHIGAGVVQPYYALTSTAFATVRNYIPWGYTYDMSSTFREGILSSLSFGAVWDRASKPLTVTIHNPSEDPGCRKFDLMTTSVMMGTVMMGGELVLIRSDTSGEVHTFEYRMTFADHIRSGMYEGNLVFTNAAQGDRFITIPFGAYFGFETLLELNPHSDHNFGTVPIGYTASAVQPLSVNVRNTYDMAVARSVLGLIRSECG